MLSRSGTRWCQGDLLVGQVEKPSRGGCGEGLKSSPRKVVVVVVLLGVPQGSPLLVKPSPGRNSFPQITLHPADLFLVFSLVQPVWV